VPGLSISAMRPIYPAPASAAPAAWRSRPRSFSPLPGSTSTPLRLEIDVSHGKVIGVADDGGDAAIFLDSPWWEAASVVGHHQARYQSNADILILSMETYNFIVGLCGLVFMGATLVYTRESVVLMRKNMSARQKAFASATPWWKSKSIAIMLGLALLTWARWVYGLIFPPTPEAISDYAYGTVQTGDEYILAFLKQTKKDKKVIGLAFHYDGRQDVKDTAGLQKSKPYDYDQGRVMMIIDPDQTFRNQRAMRMRGTNYYVIEVPDGLAPEQFSTLRQAEKLGGKVIFSKGKLP
jgi:hypothetical protein